MKVEKEEKGEERKDKLYVVEVKSVQKERRNDGKEERKGEGKRYW